MLKSKIDKCAKHFIKIILPHCNRKVDEEFAYLIFLLGVEYGKKNK